MQVYLKFQNNELFEVTGNGKYDSSTTTSELASNESYDFDHIYLFKETALKLRHLNFKRFGHLVTEVQDDYGVGRVKFVKAPSDYATYLQNELNQHHLPDPVVLPSAKDVKILSRDELAPLHIKSIEGQTISVDEFKREYFGNNPFRSKSEVTRPLTKEEAKLKRQETQAGATLKQVSFVVNRVTEIISQGASEFGLVEDLLPESVTAVKEVFPFVKLTQAPKSETYQPSTGRLVTVEFLD